MMIMSIKNTERAAAVNSSFVYEWTDGADEAFVLP